MVLVLCDWVQGRAEPDGEGDAYWFCRQRGDDVVH